MAAGEAVPPPKVDCSVGSASILASAKNHPISKAVELPLSYSTVVQNLRHGQPAASSVLTETRLHPNVWLADDIQKLKPFSIILGKPSLSFSASEKNQLVHNIKHVLIGKFSHGRPPMTSIKQFFANLKLQGEYNLSSFDSKHLYIECSNNIDFYRIWMKLVWYIKGYPMRVFQWSCDFSPRRESPVAPVWIRLEGIPLYLFDKMSLLSIANSIGKPICIDPRNLNRSMLNCALVCVELDVSMQLSNEVWIDFKDDTSGVSLGGFWVQVFYDFVPHFCSSCCHLGHSSTRCKNRQQTDLVGVASTVSCEAPQQGGLASVDKSHSQGTNCLVLPKLVSWQPVEKRQVSHIKGKAGTGQEQAVDMSNRFGILEQQQAAPGNLAAAVHPVSIIVTPAGVSSLNELHEECLTNGASSESGSQPQVALHSQKEVFMVSSGHIGTTDKQQANQEVGNTLSRNIAEVLDTEEMVQPTPTDNLTSSNTKGDNQILKSATEDYSELNPVQALDELTGIMISAGIQVTEQPSALLSQDRAESSAIEYPNSGQLSSSTPTDPIRSWSGPPATRNEGPDSHAEATPIQTTISGAKLAGIAEQEETIIEAGTPILLVEDVHYSCSNKGQQEQLKAEGEVQQIAEMPLQGKEQAEDGSVCGIVTPRSPRQRTTMQKTTAVKFNQLKFCDEVEQRKNKLRKNGSSKDQKAIKVLRSSKGILHRDGYWCDPNAIDETWFHPYTRRLPKKVMKELGIF